MKSEKFRCKKDMWDRVASAKEGTHVPVCIRKGEAECSETEREQKKWHQKPEEGDATTLKALVRCDLVKVQEERNSKVKMVRQK